MQREDEPLFLSQSWMVPVDVQGFPESQKGADDSPLSLVPLVLWIKYCQQVNEA